MSHMMFAEQENAGLHPPSVKMRQRLQSAPNGETINFFFIHITVQKKHLEKFVLTVCVISSRKTSKITHGS